MEKNNTRKTQSRLTHNRRNGAAAHVTLGANQTPSAWQSPRAKFNCRPPPCVDPPGADEKRRLLSEARIAGIMGAKRTSELEPLCTPSLDAVESTSTRMIPARG